MRNARRKGLNVLCVVFGCVFFQSVWGRVLLQKFHTEMRGRAQSSWIYLMFIKLLIIIPYKLSKQHPLSF